MKSLYALQPYQVGSKDRKSLAVIIPAKVAKQYNIDKSTVFALQVDEHKKRLMLQMIDKALTNDCADIATVENGLSIQ